ncbi:MAG: ACP S-malonyltransferase, partial [Chloroflexota bacterium]
AAAVELAKAAGAKRAVPLAVSAPFHSQLMRPAGERLAAELAKVAVQRGSFPVCANVDAAPVTDPAKIRDNLVAQVSSPVLWEASVRRMIADGVTRFVELGPGKTLSAMIKKIDKDVTVSNVEDAASLADTVAQLKECAE